MKATPALASYLTFLASHLIVKRTISTTSGLEQLLLSSFSAWSSLSSRSASPLSRATPLPSCVAVMIVRSRVLIRLLNAGTHCVVLLSHAASALTEKFNGA